MTIGSTLRLLREYHGLKQVDVANRLDLPRSLISELESERKSPGFEVLRKYAEGFDIPVSNLLLLAELKDSKDSSFLENPPKYLAKKIFKIIEWLNDRELPSNESTKSSGS